MWSSLHREVLPQVPASRREPRLAAEVGRLHRVRVRNQVRIFSLKSRPARQIIYQPFSKTAFYYYSLLQVVIWLHPFPFAWKLVEGGLEILFPTLYR